MTAQQHGNPADSRGVTVALAAFHHELATGAGSRQAMLAALRSVASLMKDEIADEAADICAQTVLEAVGGELKRWQVLKDWLDGQPRRTWPGVDDDMASAAADAYRAVLARMSELEAGE